MDNDTSARGGHHQPMIDAGLPRGIDLDPEAINFGNFVAGSPSFPSLCSRSKAVIASYSFTFRSRLPTLAEQVWNHASSFAGVNRELWPLVRMTCPPTQQRMSFDTFPVGRPVFRSWILLFGVIPVEYDDFTLIALEPGREFHEVSHLLTMRQWQHRRSVLPTVGGCVVSDEITMAPRWRGTGWLLACVYRCVFAWRHRRLRRLFKAV